MKRRNWTNTDAQGFSAAYDTGRPLIGSDLLCVRIARDTSETLPDIGLIRPTRSSKVVRKNRTRSISTMAQGSRQPTRANETVPHGATHCGYVQAEVYRDLRPDLKAGMIGRRSIWKMLNQRIRQTMNAATLISVPTVTRCSAAMSS